MAGEIHSKNRRSIYLLSILTLLPMSYFLYSAPLLVSLSLDGNWRNYTTGYYTTLAKDYVGSWLAFCIIFAAVLAFIGLYNGIALYGNVSLHYLMETSQKSLTNAAGSGSSSSRSGSGSISTDTEETSDSNSIAKILNELESNFCCLKPLLMLNNETSNKKDNEKEKSKDIIISEKDQKTVDSNNKNVNKNIYDNISDISSDLEDILDVSTVYEKIAMTPDTYDHLRRKSQTNPNIGSINEFIETSLEKEENMQLIAEMNGIEANEETEEEEEEEATGVRRIWIIINLGIVLVLIWWPFDLIIKAEMLVFSLLEIMTVFSYLLFRLRWKPMHNKVENWQNRNNVISMSINDSNRNISAINDWKRKGLRETELNKMKQSMPKMLTDKELVYSVPCSYFGVFLVTIPPIIVHCANIWITLRYSSTAISNAGAAAAIIGFGIIIDVLQRCCKALKLC